MERTVTINKAKELFGTYFIGKEELLSISDCFSINIPDVLPEIPFSTKDLTNKCKDYILILGVSKMKDGQKITINTLRSYFGISPEISEPCFYNQDWYLNDNFSNIGLKDKWYLIRKNVIDSTRAQLPNEGANTFNLPTAVLCAYTFFSTWYYLSEYLWKHDFVWCSDHDNKGDRIYVGRYIDINGLNKNGFNVHRHLKLRNNYGSIDSF